MNDSLYDVFHVMEILLSDHLQCLPVSHGLDKNKVVSLICEDNEVQFFWSVLTFDLDDETSKTVLVSTWITIRGFSYASAIVEQLNTSLQEYFSKQNPSGRNSNQSLISR